MGDRSAAHRTRVQEEAGSLVRIARQILSVSDDFGTDKEDEAIDDLTERLIPQARTTLDTVSEATYKMQYGI